MCQFWLFLQKIEVPLVDKPSGMASSQRQPTSVDSNVHGKEVVAGPGVGHQASKVCFDHHMVPVGCCQLDRYHPLASSLIFLLIPIVILRWACSHSLDDSRIPPRGNLRLDGDHVYLMPPIIAEVEPVAKSIIIF
jgi:hypothetical protein